MSRLRLFFTILILTSGAFSAAFSAANATTARVPVATGFDFPVGDVDGKGYYKARGYQQTGHPGEDWNGPKGGDSDLGDPVFSIAEGIVILARNVKGGWGNSVIVRHAYYEKGKLCYIDSLYSHLDEITVREGTTVSRRQRLGTIGNNRGMYHAHLHFEIRKNLQIGMNRSSFGCDLSNYHDPTRFIAMRRSISARSAHALVATNTFRNPVESQFADASAKPRHTSNKSIRIGRANVSLPPAPDGLKLRITATYGETRIRKFD